MILIQFYHEYLMKSIIILHYKKSNDSLYYISIFMKGRKYVHMYILHRILQTNNN